MFRALMAGKYPALCAGMAVALLASGIVWQAVGLLAVAWLLTALQQGA